MGSSSYMVEFQSGEEFNTTFHQTAGEVQREIERARTNGWTLVRILRDYVVISEAELRRGAEKEKACR